MREKRSLAFDDRIYSFDAESLSMAVTYTYFGFDPSKNAEFYRYGSFDIVHVHGFFVEVDGVNTYQYESHNLELELCHEGSMAGDIEYLE